MSYLTYNGKFVTSEGKLTVSVATVDPVTGVVQWSDIQPPDFYDPDYGFVQFDEHPDVSGNCTISFKMFLEPNASTGHLFSFGDASVGNFYAYLSSQYVSGLGRQVYWLNVAEFFKQWRGYEVTFHRNKAVWCEIKKSGSAILSVQVDSSILTPLVGGVPGPESGKTYRSRIALGGVFDASSALGSSGLRSAYIWDISIGTTHAWSGKGPNANTNAAWVDLVGDIDGTVYGSPGIKELSGI